MNPMGLMQLMRGGPQQFLQQMMSNNQVMSNPMAKNAIGMAQQGDMKGIEQLARNLCKEKGLNADDIFNQFKRNIGV